MIMHQICTVSVAGIYEGSVKRFASFDSWAD